MFNLHLLQKSLTVDEFREVFRNYHRNETLLGQFPAYTIARCPYCLEANIERVNTYVVDSHRLGASVFSTKGIIQHCQHFSFVHTFYHFHGFKPTDALRGEFFRPEVPFVVGFLLRRRWCKAVIHALPVCRIENNEFVPRFTMFLVVYFAKKPAEAYKTLVSWASTGPGAEGYASDFRLPSKGDELWEDLRHWIAAGSLFWMDANDPELPIRTRNVDAFPYGNITGRTTSEFASRINRSGG
jgi:hypothetical protein